MKRGKAAKVLEIMKMTINGLCPTENEALDTAIHALTIIKKEPDGSVTFDDYARGWNDCLDEAERCTTQKKDT